MYAIACVCVGLSQDNRSKKQQWKRKQNAHNDFVNRMEKGLGRKQGQSRTSSKEKHTSIIIRVQGQVWASVAQEIIMPGLVSLCLLRIVAVVCCCVGGVEEFLLLVGFCRGCWTIC